LIIQGNEDIDEDIGFIIRGWDDKNDGILLECYVIRRSQVIGDISRIGLMCSYVKLDEISNKVFKGKL